MKDNNYVKAKLFKPKKKGTQVMKAEKPKPYKNPAKDKK